MYRKTYLKINEEQLQKNVQAIIKQYPQYQYYIGVVKNDCYHHGIESIPALIKGGINYLAVSSLEEAIKVRKINEEIPILCLEPISIEYLNTILNAKITITIDSLEYVKELVKLDFKKELKVHLAIDTGMHRLGFTKSNEVKDAYYSLSHHPNIMVEGIFSHFATSGVMDPYYDTQVANFLSLTKDLRIEEIPLVHFGRSLSLVQHEKLTFCNGIRLGIVLYGYSQSEEEEKSFKTKVRQMKRQYLQKKYQCSKTTTQNQLNVHPALQLLTTIMSKRKVKKGDLVGYDCTKIKQTGYLYTCPIGYADGVHKGFQNVYIHNTKCPIISGCMDMIMVFSKTSFKIGEEVEIIGEHQSVKDITRVLNLNVYQVLNQITSRVAKVYQE